MPNSLQSEPVRDLLNRLFKAAEGDDLRRVRVAMAHPDGFGPVSVHEQADAYEEIYIPISPKAGRLIYSLIRAAARPRWWSSAPGSASRASTWPPAVRDNGAGRVISTELNAAKVARATANIAEARPG